MSYRFRSGIGGRNQFIATADNDGDLEFTISEHHRMGRTASLFVPNEAAWGLLEFLVKFLKPEVDDDV
jgi:hypothetical protein